MPVELASRTACVSSCHRDYENEARELQQQKIELELQFPTLCVPDPDLSGDHTVHTPPPLSVSLTQTSQVHTMRVTMHTYIHMYVPPYSLCP